MATNLFKQYTDDAVKTATIDGLGEVKYRELTMDEGDTFAKSLVKKYDLVSGKPEIDFDEATAQKYAKVALCLIDQPDITVEFLKTLPLAASGAINDLVDLIDPPKTDMLDEEGNLKNSNPKKSPNTK